MDTSLAENGHGTNGGGATSAGAGAGAAAVSGATPTTAAHCLKLKPSLPPELSKWIEYNDMSSKNLRSGC